MNIATVTFIAGKNTGFSLQSQATRRGLQTLTKKKSFTEAADMGIDRKLKTRPHLPVSDRQRWARLL